MKLSELNDLDFQNPGSWPTVAKVLAASLIVIAICVGGYVLKTKEQRETLERFVAEEREKRLELERKQQKAANLEALQEQLDQMQEILRSMLRQLPSETEMPELLQDVSQTALASGIESELFEPGPETVKEFYAEKPISLRMVGTYHEFGTFVSGVASLPRVVILTMHDISLRPSGRADAEPGQLILEGTAKTYRYVEDTELKLDEPA